MWDKRNPFNRARRCAFGVKPRPFALRWVKDEAEGRAPFLQQLPHLLQKLDLADDTAVIHVPLVVSGAEGIDVEPAG